VWILDDDAWPAANAIEELTRDQLYSDRAYSSLVLDSTTGDLSFPIIALKNEAPHLVESLASIPKQRIFPIGGSWLGCLLPRQIVQDVGPVNADLFIRGEDEDYPRRIKERGYSFFCVQSSILFHPSMRMRKITAFGKHFFYEPLLPPWKAYYSVRNKVYVQRHSDRGARGLVKALLTAAASIGCALCFDNIRWQRVRLYSQAAFDGITGRLGRRTR